MEFIQLYSDVDNDIDIDEDIDDEQVSMSKDDYTFTDDTKQTNGNNVDFHREFEHETKKLNEPIDDHEDWLDQRDIQPSNYVS